MQRVYIVGATSGYVSSLAFLSSPLCVALAACFSASKRQGIHINEFYQLYPHTVRLLFYFVLVQRQPRLPSAGRFCLCLFPYSLSSSACLSIRLSWFLAFSDTALSLSRSCRGRKQWRQLRDAIAQTSRLHPDQRTIFVG